MLEDCIREARRQETSTMALHKKLVDLRLDILGRLSQLKDEEVDYTKMIWRCVKCNEEGIEDFRKNHSCNFTSQEE